MAMSFSHKILCVFADNDHGHRREGNDRCGFGTKVVRPGPSAGLAPALGGFSCWWWQVRDIYLAKSVKYIIFIIIYPPGHIDAVDTHHCMICVLKEHWCA